MTIIEFLEGLEKVMKENGLTGHEEIYITYWKDGWCDDPGIHQLNFNKSGIEIESEKK